jgi:hypothetical protein
MMKFTRTPRPAYLENYKEWGRTYAQQRQQGQKFKWKVREKLKTDLARVCKVRISIDVEPPPKKNKSVKSVNPLYL